MLFDQIVRRDSYGLRPYFHCPPRWILDVGANVGYFSVLCRMLFPQARIVAVEPCPATQRFLNHNTMGLNIERQAVALAAHPVDIRLGADCGSNFCQPGTSIPGLLLPQMIERWGLDPKERYMIKVDCEGGERTLLDDRPGRELLLGACHAALELHYQCEKWPSAAPKEQLTDLVQYLQQNWHGGSTWRPALKGGELLLQTEIA